MVLYRGFRGDYRMGKGIPEKNYGKRRKTRFKTNICRYRWILCNIYWSYLNAGNRRKLTDLLDKKCD
jgi:hypothetical protein